MRAFQAAQGIVARAWLAEVDGFQIGEKRRHVGLADPADEEILLDRGSDRAAGIAGHNVRQRAKLVGGDVAQREGDRGGDIAGLTLVADVGLDPPPEGFVAVQGGKFPWRLERTFHRLLGAFEAIEPARVFP